MQIERCVIGTLRTLVLTSSVVLGLSACDGDDGGDDGVAEAGDAEAGETFDRTDADVGESESDGGETLGRTDGDVGEGASTDTGGELTGCAALENEAECIAMDGCAAVLGNAVVEDGRGSWCTMADEQYIGCVDTMNLCPPLTKVLCAGDQMWTTTDCVPDNLMVCEAPGTISGTCA